MLNYNETVNNTTFSFATLVKKTKEKLRINNEPYNILLYKEIEQKTSGLVNK